MQKIQNKTKKELVQHQQLVQRADRLKEVLKTKVFPFLKDMNEDVRYTKIFVEAASTAVRMEFDNGRKKTPIGSLEMHKLFDQKEEKTKKYNELYALLGDMSVADFEEVLGELPRMIDGYVLMQNSKKKLNELDLDALLG